MKKKRSLPSILYLSLLFLFLFAPIAVLIVFSFNEGRSTVNLSGFSLRWYKNLFSDEATLQSLCNSLILAVSSAAISTVMGTLAAYGISRMRRKYFKGLLLGVTNVPMMNPDIITGISLMLMFVFTGTLLGLAESLSFATMLIAHVTFNLPYVILSVLPKFNQMDPSMPEAALDLGCTPVKSFFRVELPEIMPGVMTGGLMAFTLSLDDFVISYFTKGSGFQTLPLLIYGMTKKTVTPKIYALATLIFLSILILLILTNVIQSRDERKQMKIQKSLNRDPVADKED